MSGPRRTAGRLSKVTDQSGTRWFNYDAQGRTAAVWDMRNVLGETCARVSTWEYDSAGRLEARRLPTGRLLEYEYTGPDSAQPRALYVTRTDVDCSTTACPTE